MALLTKRMKATLRMRYPYLTGAGQLNRWRVLLPALLLLLTNSIAVAAPPTEYEVKAAFIHNIAKLVEWPVPSAPASSLKLCIVGRDPFNGAAEALRHKQIDGMDWEVLNVGAQSGLRECRVLFIAASEAGNLKRILENVKGSAVLTVGDTGGYAGQGVMVNFYLEEERVRFEINAEAARRANLKLSSQLLKLARVVQEPAP